MKRSVASPSTTRSFSRIPSPAKSGRRAPSQVAAEQADRALSEPDSTAICAGIPNHLGPPSHGDEVETGHVPCTQNSKSCTLSYLGAMPVGHYAFCLLELPEQLATVWQEGQFLATRFGNGHAVNLYRMDGDFFAEVYYQQDQDVLSQVRAFTSGKCLEPYAAYIRLDDLNS